MKRASGHTAVMAARHDAVDALDYFPTPPWATRALLEHVIPDASGTAWDPACGGGHMVHVLCECFNPVYASDVHDYGGRQWVGSFVGTGPDVIHERFTDPVDWIITNPPFNLAVEFVLRALDRARVGVAMLVRTAWLEGAGRWDLLFRDTPPAIVAPFVERVPMVKGRWDPDASTATAYAWFVWRRLEVRGVTGVVVPGLGRWGHADGTRLVWIPPGCRQRLTRPEDLAMFTEEAP